MESGNLNPTNSCLLTSLSLAMLIHPNSGLRLDHSPESPRKTSSVNYETPAPKQKELEKLIRC